MAGLGVLIAIIYAIAGLLIDVAIDYISPQSEFELFNQFARQAPVAEFTAKDIQDSPRAQQIRALVDAMSSCANIAYPITTEYREQSLNNAMAIPGGRMVVFAGVFDNLKSENALGFVIAHELAHFANRDHIRSMGRGIVVVAATHLLGFSQSSIGDLVMPVESFSAAHFSQTIESAADERALEILNCHYDHVAGATAFFETLKNSQGDNGFALVHYFSTHPEVQSRIDKLNQLIIERGYQQGELLPLKVK